MANQPSEYEKKLIQMQFQMKENQSFMKDYFEDLDKWTQDIKEKEKKIIQDPDSKKNLNKGLPPIRNLATTKKKKKIKKTTESNKDAATKTKKLNSYDYRAWDKLDVDKLCQEVDEHKTSSSEYTTDEEWEEQQRKVKAEWEKERGNQFFKDNMLNEAINCYTQATQLDPLNAVYPANRAMCLIKQEKYGAAEADCSLSISLDPKYTKAYHRRATARVKLGKIQEAKNDYEHLLKFEPNSKLFQTEFNKLEQMIENRSFVFPIEKTEDQKSKKPLKKIIIEEINDESTEKAQIQKNLEEINQKISLTSKEESLFQVEKNTDELEEKTKKVELKEPDLKPEIKQIQVPEVKKTIPNPPANGYQFKKDWQLLGNDMKRLAEYLKKIPPTDYSKLFLNGLESDTLSKILLIFRNYFINDSEIDLKNNMKCLSQVKRFNTQFMFLTSNDKKAIEDIFNYLKSQSQVDKNELENLEKVYKF